MLGSFQVVVFRSVVPHILLSTFEVLFFGGGRGSALKFRVEVGNSSAPYITLMKLFRVARR